MLIEYSETDLAWAAGFIDGEGCLYSNGGTTPAMYVGQKTIEPLLKLKDIFGIGKIYEYKRLLPSGKETQFKTYYLSGKELLLILKRLIPYMIVKRIKAIALLDKFENEYDFNSPTRKYIMRKRLSSSH